MLAEDKSSSVLPHEACSITFSCAEQFYMFAKALYFGDSTISTRILATTDPKDQKKLGQMVKGFNEYKWGRVKYRVAVVGNWYKYCQNEGLRAVLLGTGEKELAEASRRDRVWGIGFAAREADAHREEWGESLLGRALMRVRGRLREWKQREGEGEKVDWEWDGSEDEQGINREPEGASAVQAETEREMEEE